MERMSMEKLLLAISRIANSNAAVVAKPNRPKRHQLRGEDEFFASDYEGIYFNTDAFGTHCVLFLIQIP